MVLQRWRQCLLQQQLVLLLLAMIQHYNSIRDRYNLSRQAIVLPRSSPWQHLFDNADPDSFLLMTGVTRDVFGMLLTILYPASTIQRLIRAKGRPRLMSPHAELGLFLFYIGSTMQIKHLCLIFGITPTRCAAVIRHLLRAIPSKLQLRAKNGRICCHDRTKRTSWHDVIGFMDGVALHSECSSEITQQNSMYNGYHSDTMVNNVIAYGADGKVFCVV